MVVPHCCCFKGPIKYQWIYSHVLFVGIFLSLLYKWKINVRKAWNEFICHQSPENIAGYLIHVQSVANAVITQNLLSNKVDTSSAQSEASAP